MQTRLFAYDRRRGQARRPRGWYDGGRAGPAGPEYTRQRVKVREGNKVLFLRHGRALEGRVFAVHEGAYSVESAGNRAYYLDYWEILLVLDFDEAYAGWLADPLGAEG